MIFPIICPFYKYLILGIAPPHSSFYLVFVNSHNKALMPFTGGEGPVGLFFGKTAYMIIPFQSKDAYLLFSKTYIIYRTR